MAFRDLKYVAAYTIPLLTYLGITCGGYMTYSTFIFAFLIIPALELFISPNRKNLSKTESARKEVMAFFDLLLYLNVPIVFFILYYYLNALSTGSYTWFEMIGMMLGVGIVLGSNGINVAHEIGHRDGKLEKSISKILLLPSMYMHFIIEHNVGHHKNVGTYEDPATARLNESLFQFWARSSIKGYFHAWTIENKRLQNLGLPSFHIKNEMIWFLLIQLGFIFLIFLNFGAFILGFYLASAIMGFTLLETINYIEHYGLRRLKTVSGRYERVENFHSWNSDHELGRIFLYELTRHSDHHFKANKKYQILQSHDDSPQLPYGYPGSMFLAFLPPIWFAIMNKRIPAQMKNSDS